MTQKKAFLALSGVFWVLFAAVIVVGAYSRANTDILKKTPLETGRQNSCLGYDESTGNLLVGTYNNELVAFSPDAEALWRMQANGPFKQLVVHAGARTVYAGNEDNNVYIVDLDSGEVKSSINVQRRIYGIDVTPDGGEIMVSAGVGTNKHSILLYTPEGEQTQNLQFGIRIQGAAYAPDYEHILLGNNRAELTCIDTEGNVQAETRLQYEITALARLGGTDSYAALCKDGVYTVVDSGMNILRSGKPMESFAVSGRSVGSDASGSYLVVGTEEGFIYLFDGADSQIFASRMPNSVTSFMAVGEDIYLTGLGDFVYEFSTGGLALVSALNSLAPALGALTWALPLMAVACFLWGVGKTRSALVRAGRVVYRHKVAYLLLIPIFGLLIMFNYRSVFIAVTRAFTNWSKDNTTWATMKFVGLDNFRLMFSEAYFLVGLGNLALLLATGFVKVLTVPLLVAWLVYSMAGGRQKTAFRFLFVLPMVVPGVVYAMMWKQIYDPTIGLLNQLLGKMGLETLQRVWLGDARLAIWAIVFMGFPFVNALAFLVYYGGLMDIDACIVESARIDGSGRAGIFFRIQLPMVVPQLKVILVLTFIGTVQEFTSIYLLTAGGPGISTYVPGLELYFNATKFGRFGYACALGLVMFLFTMVGTIANMRIKSDVG